MLTKGDIVKIKPEYLSEEEKKDPKYAEMEYYVTDYNPNNGHTEVICAWSGFTGYLKYVWPNYTMYKVGHVDPESLKRLFTETK